MSVSCLHDNIENKIEKTIINYKDLFINTSLNHMPIRCRLVSQLENKLILNNEQLSSVTDLWPISFSVILSPNPRGKILINSRIDLGTTDENKNSKVRTIEILSNSVTRASIVCKDILYEHHKILKQKK